ncbi:MAG: energy transducer TonB [Muribaculaceae bacterium]|nr:energy transducer TonB [Muribaculaceae bacterium]
MAKDVDLSSKEWRDIVFEGKNKEFGAYTLRADSVRRHTKAIAIVLIVAIIGLVLLGLFYNGVFGKPDEDQITITTDIELTTFDQDEIEEEIEDEEVFELPQEPEEIIAPEEVANEQQVTNILVTDDKDYEEDKQVKNQDEVMDNASMIGSVDVTEGVEDLNKTRIIDQVIVEEKPVVEDEVYNIAMVEQQPEFPGGAQAMYKWLGDHINYPPVAAEEGVQGKVIVEFVVSKTGSIENVRVLRGRHPALDKEAIRVVKAMPKWNPGRNNGNAVKVTYTLPVTFKLQQ